MRLAHVPQLPMPHLYFRWGQGNCLMPARTTRLLFSFTSAANSSPPLWIVMVGMARFVRQYIMMNPEDFRAALEQAVAGRSSNKAPFSVAWAAGKLSRAHLARWTENQYHYVGPFAEYLGNVYTRMPAAWRDAKDFL